MILRKVLAASLLPLNSLLIFLAVFANRLSIPVWLRVIGRMHPLAVHFPIVLILLYILCLFFIPKNIRQEKGYSAAIELFLIISAFTTVLTALMGLFLSREEGYDADALAYHQWAGVATSAALFLLYFFNPRLQKSVRLNYALVLIAGVLMVLAGHLGGNITHGENFVLAPVTPQNKKARASFDEAYVYADMVQPILENKCMSCHNSGKAKGELILETREMLLKGGKDGKLWDSTKADLGLLMQRIHLPEEDKDHMPPAGKPQLTNMELEILYQWVKAGANFEQKVADLLPTDTMRWMASKILKQSDDEIFDFPAAAENDIQKLGNENRVISKTYVNSPALEVNFYNRAFYTTDQLAALAPIGKQIVDLDLENMPVKDGDLKIISGFVNLRKLNLNFTPITGITLQELTKLPNLRNISLAGTKIKTEQLNELTTMHSLRNLFLWNTGIHDEEIKRLEAKNKNISYRFGFNGDTVKIKLTPPISENDTLVIAGPTQIKFKHYIKGTVIRYTLDGTDPDSLKSPRYENNLQIDSTIIVKAKAFKPGWISSEVLEQDFYKSTFRPDSVISVSQPDLKYKGEGNNPLFDLDRSDMNTGDGKWLAYKLNPMETLFYFDHTVTVKLVTISMMENVTSFIFPPSSIQIWGGMEKNSMKPLYEFKPEQPVKDPGKSENLIINCQFKPTRIKYMRMMIKPTAQIPKWLKPTKKDKAWIFMDEVMIN